MFGLKQKLPDHLVICIKSDLLVEKSPTICQLCESNNQNVMNDMFYLCKDKSRHFLVANSLRTLEYVLSVATLSPSFLKYNFHLPCAAKRQQKPIFTNFIKKWIRQKKNLKR